MRSKSLEATSFDAGGRLEFWTRSGENFVHVSDVLFGQILEGVEIYNTDEGGKLRTLIQAEKATIIGADTWLLEDVTRTQLSGMSSQRLETISKVLQWTNLLSQEQADILILPLEALAPHDLVLYIRYLRENDLDTHHFGSFSGNR